MFFINVIDDEELNTIHDSASFSKTTIACENNGIDYALKHQQSIEAVDRYRNRPEIIKLMLASGSVYSEMEYIYIENTDEWICLIKFADTNTMVLISADTFTFKYQNE